MGVNGLWDIAAPGARRIPVSVLEGRTVAVDASIWMAQFVKAMRDGNGDLLRGAHLVGFFRRLCKLYYHRLKPIIVFDGPAPALKRRTLLARRRRREQEEEELKRTAERLIAQMVRRTGRAGARAEVVGPTVTLADVVSGKLLGTEEDLEIEALRRLLPRADREGVEDRSPPPDSDDLQLARESRREYDRYRRSIPQDFRGVFEHRRRLDELNVPADLESLLKAPTAAAKPIEPETVIRSVEEFKEYHISNEAGGEDIIQIPLDCEIDESVFKALPPKVQYKILVQLRTQWLIENRKKVVAAAQADPDVFSQVQIESYLRFVRTNEEIDKVKKRIAVEQAKTGSGPKDPLEVEEDEEEGGSENAAAGGEDGSFMQFYELGEKPEAPLDFEENILKDLEQQQQRAEEEAQKLRDRIKAREAGPANTKRLKLFNEWATEGSVDPKLLERGSWFRKDHHATPPPQPARPRRNSQPQPRSPGDQSPGGAADPVDLDWDEDLTREILQNLPDLSQDADETPKLPQASELKRKVRMRRKGATPSPQCATPSPKASPALSATPPLHAAAVEEDWGDDAGWQEVEVPDLRVPDEKSILDEALRRVEVEKLKQEETKTEPPPLPKQEQLTPPDLKPVEGSVEESVEAVAEDAELEPAEEHERSPADRHTRSNPRPPAALATPPAAVGPAYEAAVIDDEVRGEGRRWATTGDDSESPPTATVGTSDDAATEVGGGPSLERSGEFAERFFDLSEKAFERRVAPSADKEFETLEEDSLLLLKGLRKERQRAAEAGREMMEEVRELLRCMGVPFIDAPGEAEAQCVELCKLSLAEVVISDDSDCLVFGGGEVIRHMFNSDTTVELFSTRDIERVLGLTVDDLRALALLLGCDYTLGITGVGIVNALEIVQAYGSDLNELKVFAQWAKNKVSPKSDILETDSELVKVYKQKHHNYRAGWDVPDEVPSAAALREFQKPRVNHSREPFHWIVPDMDSVISLLSAKASIPAEKTHQLLAPVIDRLRSGESQQRQTTLLDTFLQPPEPEATIGEYRSRRMKKAVDLIQRIRANR